jgi:hypothetical protein
VLATSLWLEFMENASPDNLVDVILVFQYDCAQTLVLQTQTIMIACWCAFMCFW